MRLLPSRRAKTTAKNRSAAGPDAGAGATEARAVSDPSNLISGGQGAGLTSARSVANATGGSSATGAIGVASLTSVIDASGETSATDASSARSSTSATDFAGPNSATRAKSELEAESYAAVAASGTNRPSRDRAEAVSEQGFAPARVVAVPEATAMLFMRTGKPHEPVAVPQVRLAPGEVLVETEFATVCGSDVHTVLGHRSEATPLVLGHEAVGRVVALGSEAPVGIGGVPVQLGDRVVWSVVVHCGSCDRCQRGLPQKCRHLRKYGHERIEQGWELTGGYATHVHLRAGTAILSVKEDLPAAVLAPAGCGIATAWAALAAAERTVSFEGATALITGGGLIGLAAAAMANERGAHVVLSDPEPGRRALAERFGVAAVIDPVMGEPAAVDARYGSVDVVIEASGSPRAIHTGIESAGVGAAIVLVGSVFPSDPISLAPERVVRRQLSISGVHNYAPEHLAGAVEFLERNWQRYPFEGLVGETYALGELDAALVRAARRREVRVGIDPRR